MPDLCKRLVFPFFLRAVATAYRFHRLSEEGTWGESTAFGTACVMAASVLYSTAYQFSEPIFQVFELLDLSGFSYLLAYVLVELVALAFQQLSLHVNLYLIWFPVHKFVSYLFVALLNHTNQQRGERIWAASIKPVFSACLGGSLLAIDLTYIKQKLWQYFKPIGTVPSREQLEAVGNQCVICYEDLQNPIMLQCGHIFCKGCVQRWFEMRGLDHRTCPVCRTSVDEELPPPHLPSDTESETAPARAASPSEETQQ